MSHVIDAITATPWAMPGEDLRRLITIASKSPAERLEARQAEGESWVRRDLDLLAGPTARRLDGAQRAYLADGGVAVLPVLGPIFPRANMFTEVSGASSVTVLQNDLRTALASRDVRAIMLLIDSPGGQVSGISSFAQAVAAAAGRKRLAAYVAGTGASAAYWIASAASEISLERTAMVGSIGVVAAVSKQVGPDSDGMMSVEIVSSNAPNKRADPLSDEGVATVRETLDAVEAIFIGDVAAGRKVTPDKVRTDFGRGGMKVGSAAVRVGMADKVESYESALHRLSHDARTFQSSGRTAHRVRALADARQILNRRRLEALRQ